MTTTPDPATTRDPSTGTTVALVTGANKGIGYETVRQLLALGWTVWLGSRDADRGSAAVDALRAEDPLGEVRLLDLDVTDDTSVAAAVETMRSTGVDVLINNAGVAGDNPTPEDTQPRDFLPVFGANLLGPVRMTHALLPMLRESSQPRIVNVSSGTGSFARMTDSDSPSSSYPDLVYPASKAALNMVTVQYAKALPGIAVNAVAPGHTATDLNDHQGPQPVDVAAAVVVGVATLGPDGPTGSFLAADGPMGW